jgi:hypothetical protein
LLVSGTQITVAIRLAFSASLCTTTRVSSEESETIGANESIARQLSKAKQPDHYALQRGGR